MALPSGRLLTYPRPRWRDVDILDKDKKPTGEKRHELSFRRAHGRAKLWHGTLCENAVQAAAADILRQTVTRIETNPALAFMPIRMTTHDEIVCEVDEARAEEAKAILRREMLTLPDWAAGLPLQSEESVCPYYTKARRCCDECPLPPSRPAFVPATRRNLALRARRCRSYRAAWRRQRRCCAHGACRADPRRQRRHALVIAPKLVATTVWPQEIASWPHLQHLRVAVLDGRPERRRAAPRTLRPRAR